NVSGAPPMPLLSFLTRRSPDHNIASPEHKASADAYYARLRASAPVHRVKLPDGQTAYLVTRYDDVVAVLKDDKRFLKNRFEALTADQLKQQPWMPGIFRPLQRNMLDLDGIDHQRLRGLVQKAFTPRLVDGMRPRIVALAEQLM